MYCEEHQSQGRWGRKTNLFKTKLFILLGALSISIIFPIIDIYFWEEGRFECPNGEIIDGSKVLDREKDCTGGWDEKRGVLFETTDAEAFREKHDDKASLELCALFCWLPLLNVIGFFIIKSYSPIEIYLEKSNVDSIISEAENEKKTEGKDVADLTVFLPLIQPAKTTKTTKDNSVLMELAGHYPGRHTCGYCGRGTDYACDVPKCNNVGGKIGICERCQKSGRAIKNSKFIETKRGWIMSRGYRIPDGYQCLNCGWSD